MLINPPAYPRYAEVDTALGGNVLVGSAVYNYIVDAAEFLNFFRLQNPGANGDSVGAYVNLEAGTYKFSVWYQKYSDRGILDFTLGSIVIGSLDTYAAALTRDQLAVFTGIIVPSSGNYLLKYIVNGKNAASSGFFICTKKMIISQ